MRLPERRLPRLALAAGGGALGVLAFAPFEQWWLAPLLWCLLCALLQRAEHWREGFLTGWSFGLGFFLAGISWVYVSLSVFGEMPAAVAALATFALCALMALYPALVGAACVRWRPPGVFAQVLLFASLWTLGEWLRGWLFTGFPWLALGYSQTPPSPLAGYAPLLGVLGVGWCTALLGALLLLGRRGVLPFVAVLALGWGLRQHEWTTPQGAPVDVALLQGNVAQDLKWNPDHFAYTLASYRDLVENHPATLTVLPETALPTFFDQVPPDYLDELRRLAARRQGDIVLGVATGDGLHYWNSAVSIGASPTQTYRKAHLVPFGEYIPVGFAWFMAMANIPFASFSPGAIPQQPLAIGGQQVAVDICYEDAFGDEIRQALPAAGILVNMSNTAWFGHSLAQPQHLQISRLRALETGRPMLRATNTGMTAYVTPDGAVQAALEPFTRGALVATVQAYCGLTPYARYGDSPTLLLAGFIGLFCIFRRKTQKSDDAAI
jgi:apolipoprotein N-acyltransferase